MNSFLLFQSIHLCLAVATKGERKVRMEIKKRRKGITLFRYFIRKICMHYHLFRIYIFFSSVTSQTLLRFSWKQVLSAKTDLYVFLLKKMFVVFAYGYFLYHARAFRKENVLLENGFCDKRMLKEKFSGVSSEIKRIQNFSIKIAYASFLYK